MEKGLEMKDSVEWISDAEFERFRDYFYQRTGIHFENNKRYFVDKRLLERMRLTNHESFNSYFTLLRFQDSGDEFQALVNALTVNETYFFREDYQFECMVKSVLPEVVANKAPGEPIKIWSVPCSTGEEAYSIALYVLEYWPGINNIDVELVASDINSDVLGRCQRGIYGQRSVQNLPPKLLARHFKRLPGGDYAISDDIKSCLSFCRVNLHDFESQRRFRNFDIIFCRNMLIYFDDISRRKAAGTLYDALNPGGFVFLGHSESMSRMSSLFRIRKFPEAILYQKPRRGEGS